MLYSSVRAIFVQRGPKFVCMYIFTHVNRPIVHAYRIVAPPRGVYFSRKTLSIGKNRTKIRAVFFEFMANRQYCTVYYNM